MKTKKIISVLLIFTFILGQCFVPNTTSEARVKLSKKEITLQKGKSTVLKVKATKGRARWRVTSGKKYIRLFSKKKASVTVKGIRKGTAKVQCRIGKRKWYCKVRVTETSDKKNAVATPSEMPTQVPTTVPTQIPTPDKNEKNPSDVMALQTLIKQQQQRGATITDNIDDKNLYEWNDEGRLISIIWSDKKIRGDISFAGLPELKIIYFPKNSVSTLDISQNKELENLGCYQNQLTALNTSQNTALEYLLCEQNQLMELDISQNKALKMLSCEQNQLTELDTSQNTALEYLICGQNQLAALDVSQNKVLKKLDCDQDQLTELDTSQNKVLKNLSCGQNQLTTLDISQNTSLSTLSCEGNQLVSLDVTVCPGIEVLYCGNNHLTSLTIRGCKYLWIFSCKNNPLTELDVTDTRVDGNGIDYGVKIINETDYNDRPLPTPMPDIEN